MVAGCRAGLGFGIVPDLETCRQSPFSLCPGQPQVEIEIIWHFAQLGVQKGLLGKAIPEVEPERMNLTSEEEGQEIQVEGKVQRKTQRFVRVVCIEGRRVKV